MAMKGRNINIRILVSMSEKCYRLGQGKCHFLWHIGFCLFTAVSSFSTASLPCSFLSNNRGF